MAILLLTSTSLFSQGWEKPYPSSTLNGSASDVLITNDSAYIALGNVGFSTAQIVKADLQGNAIWNKEYEDANLFRMEAIINTTDGGYAMTGEYHFTGIDNGIALYKLDNAGDTLWTKGYGCCSDQSHDLLQTDDGGYLLVGKRAVAPVWDSLLAYVIRTDANGNVLWDTNYFHAVGAFSAGFRRVLKRSNGNYLLLGSTDGNVKLMEIDDNGDIAWERQMENPDNHNLIEGDLSETPDGGLIVGGTRIVTSNSNQSAGGFLWKLDSNNSLDWFNSTFVQGDGVNSISVNDYGELFIARPWFIEKRDSNGTILCWHNVNKERNWNTINLAALDDGSVLASVTFRPSFFILEQFLTLVKMDTNCLAAVDLISGNVNIDADGDCINNGAGDSLHNWLVELNDGSISYYTLSDTLGDYSFVVNEGSYDITLHHPMDYWESCAQNVSVSIGPSPDTMVLDLQAIVLEDCPFLVVDLASPPLRPCEERQVSIAYSNLGPVTAEDTYIQVSLDTLISINSASVPYTTLPNNVYQFDLGDVEQGDFGLIYFQAFLDCDAMLGSTVCLEASIYPDTLCGSQNWAGAIIEVTGECTGEEIIFEIKNIGSANMVAPLEYVVVEDHVMYMIMNFDLDVGQSDTVTIPNEHATYVTQAQQEPGYPFGQYATDMVSFCQNQNNSNPFSSNFFYQFPYDDGSPTVDIECVLVGNSFDPNQKTATPIGYGDEHQIEANTPIEYHIDFQNTGNDTAYNIMIRDTLSTHLDIRTLVAGAASHAYDLTIEGNGILVFTFPNINLVDSVANEPLSHGYVEYKIGQQPDLPLGSVIENSAAIYFDFNDPIITNTTWHTIGENFVTVDIDEKYSDVLLLDVYPNPVSGNAYLQLKGVENTNAEMHLFNTVGQQLDELFFENGMARVNPQLPSGVYFFQVLEKGNLIGAGKLVIK